MLPSIFLAPFALGGRENHWVAGDQDKKEFLLWVGPTSRFDWRSRLHQWHLQPGLLAGLLRISRWSS